MSGVLALILGLAAVIGPGMSGDVDLSSPGVGVRLRGELRSGEYVRFFPNRVKSADGSYAVEGCFGSGKDVGRIAGTVRYRVDAAGALHTEWTLAPDRPVALKGLWVEFVPFACAEYAGGRLETDGRMRPIPPSRVERHVFNGDIRTLRILDGADRRRLALDFPVPTHVLFQDESWWGAVPRKAFQLRVDAVPRDCQIKSGGSVRLAYVVHGAEPYVWQDPWASPSGSADTSPLELRAGRQLFVDDALIASARGVTRHWNTPYKLEKPIIRPRDTPTHRGCAVATDGGLWWDPTRQVFRLWYEERWCGQLCYAESKDGLKWTFPDLGIVKGTNRLFADADRYHTDSFIVFPDYKADDPYASWKLYNSYGNPRPNPIYESKDGIRFTRLGFAGWAGDRSTAYFDAIRGKWDTGYLSAMGGVCVIRDETLWFYYSGLRGDGMRPVTPAVAAVKKAGDFTSWGMYSNGSIGAATLRRDGFAGLVADGAGEVVTRPFFVRGNRLFVNAEADFGEVRVEVLDEKGAALAGLSAADCRGLVGDDRTKAEIVWKDKTSPLASLRGRAVRLRFTLRNATLYSFWLTDSPDGHSSGYVAGGGPAYPGLRDVPARP